MESYSGYYTVEWGSKIKGECTLFDARGDIIVADEIYPRRESL